MTTFKICPSCKRYGTQINEINNKIEITCLRCNFKWCNQCMSEYHGSDSCHKIKLEKSHPSFKSNLINKINEIIHKNYSHYCPYCKSEYIKISGCNKIICSKCEGQSCYLCGFKITRKIGTSWYWHFKGNPYNDGTSSCGLFSDDIENKDSKLISEILLFINTNSHIKKQIRKILPELLNNNSNTFRITMKDFNFKLKTSFFERIINMIKTKLN